MRFQASIGSKNIDYEKIYLYVLIGFAFILPLSRAAISFFTILLPLIWLFEGDFKRKFEQIKNQKVILFLALFIVYGYMSLSWTEVQNFKDGIGIATKPLRIIFIPMLIIITSLKPEHISKVITGFLLGMLVSEILSYGIFFELWILPVGAGTPLDPSPFMHHLDYSTFLTFTALLLLNRFFTISDLKWKLFYFVYFIFVTSNLFLNGGKTGQLAFAISIFVVGFLNIKNKFKALVLMLLLISITIYTAYQISPIFKDRINNSVKEMIVLQGNSSEQYNGSSIGLRIGTWLISKDVIEEYFFFGTGAGTENKKIKEYGKKHPDKEYLITTMGSYHNQYIQIFVRLGLIGLLIYLLMWYFIAKIVIEDKSLSNLRYIFIAVFLIASIPENIFENQFPMTLFGIFVGIFIATNNQKLSINNTLIS